MQDTKAVKFNISQDSVLDKEDGLFAGQHHYLAEPSEPSSVFRFLSYGFARTSRYPGAGSSNL